MLLWLLSIAASHLLRRRSEKTGHHPNKWDITTERTAASRPWVDSQGTLKRDSFEISDSTIQNILCRKSCFHSISLYLSDAFFIKLQFSLCQNTIEKCVKVWKVAKNGKGRRRALRPLKVSTNKSCHKLLAIHCAIAKVKSKSLKINDSVVPSSLQVS